MRIRLETIGCRLNISEIETWARLLSAAGHRLSVPGDPADLVIFNTCAVTADAARTSRQLARQLQRAHPGAPLVVTGCFATLDPHRAADLGAALVVSNAEKDRLLDLLAEAGLLHPADPLPEPDQPPQPASRTRAFVKVQDGCDNHCTFCIVTVARGVGRSRPLSEIIAEINTLVVGGYNEAVLTGVHLGSYGRGLDQPHGLADLVRAILTDTDLPRLRLSSLEPWDLDEHFFELWSRSPRLLPHLHLPLQSGDDTILRRMARRTTRADFAQLVAHARAAIPDLAISTDIIVGFPGETDAQFQNTLNYVRELAFSRLHIFRYSARTGTAAASFPGQLSKALITERVRQMHILGAELEHAFLAAHIGRTLPVLWEHAEPFGTGQRWSGLTPNYLRVLLETPPAINLHNQVTAVDIRAVLPGALLASDPTQPPPAPRLDLRLTSAAE